MNDCCKTGNEKEQKQRGIKKWFNYMVYGIIALILVGTLISQIIQS